MLRWPDPERVMSYVTARWRARRVKLGGAFLPPHCSAPLFSPPTRRRTTGEAIAAFTSRGFCSTSSALARAIDAVARYRLRFPFPPPETPEKPNRLNFDHGRQERKTRRNRGGDRRCRRDRKDLGRVRTWELQEQAVGQGDHQKRRRRQRFRPPPIDSFEYTEYKGKTARRGLPFRAISDLSQSHCLNEISTLWLPPDSISTSTL
jgi:hypothetical protein